MKNILLILLSLIIGVTAVYLGIVLGQSINFGIPICHVALFVISIIVSLISTIVFALDLLTKQINVPRSLLVIAIVDFLFILVPFRMINCT